MSGKENVNLWKSYVAMVKFESEDDSRDFLEEVQKNRFVDAGSESEKTIRVESSEVVVNEFSFWDIIDSALWEVRPNSVIISFSTEFHYEF